MSLPRPIQSEFRIGIDLGGTKIEGVALRRIGGNSGAGRAAGAKVRFEEITRLRRPTQREGGYEHVLARTADLIAEVGRAANLPELPPIGVGMPGSITELGLVKNSNTTCLNGRPFRSDLAARVGHPVAFANDANCFALAETVLGAAQGARVAFGVILGTGCGGGVVFAEGGVPRIWDGHQGIAGEWGHMVLDPEHGPPCYCGRRGCVEQYLCGPAIETAYTARTGKKKPVAELAATSSTDPIARETLRAAVEVFGRALGAVINVLDPDVVVLGGGVSNLDIFYTEGIEAVRRWVFSDTLRTRIVKHSIGDSAGSLGAALLWE